MVEFEEPVIWASVGLLSGAALALTRRRTGAVRPNPEPTEMNDRPCTDSVEPLDEEEDGPLLTVLAVFGCATRRQFIDHAFSGPAVVELWLSSAERRGLIARIGPDAWTLRAAGYHRLEELS